MLNRKKENIDANRARSVNEYVELEFNILGQKQDGTPIQSIEEDEQDPSQDENA